MIRAYRMLSDRVPYPLHLGVTEAGPAFQGTIKSSVAFGALLSKGIGDTIRVSLSAPPVEEVKVGNQILQSLNLRPRKLEIVSCPSCGRAQVDVYTLADQVTAGLDGMTIPLRVAVMGCVVNGPGEAREADLGVASGNGKGQIFVKGEVIKTVPESQIVETLIDEAMRLAEGMESDEAAGERLDVAGLADLRMHAAPALHAVDRARLEQQPVADRRAPVGRDKPLQREAAIDARFRGGRRRDRRRAGAEVLEVGGHPERVLRVHLPGEATLVDLLLLVEDRLSRRRHVVEAVQVVRVLVVEHAGDVVVGHQVAARHEEPDGIALDRTADGEVGIPVLDEPRRLGDAVLDRVLRGQAWRPGVAVGDGDRDQHDAAADDADEDIHAHRSRRQPASE